jgi:hypothetical protein
MDRKLDAKPTGAATGISIFGTCDGKATVEVRKNAGLRPELLYGARAQAAKEISATIQ